MKNVKALFLGFLLMTGIAFSSEAFADAPLYKYSGYTEQNSFGGDIRFGGVPTAEAACQVWVDNRNAQAPSRDLQITSVFLEFSPDSPASGNLCRVLHSNGNSHTVGYRSLNPEAYCSDGSPVTDGECPDGTGEVQPVEPEECIELGQAYDPATQQCTTECANGAMDNICLTTPDPTCSESSADYQGTVGWGEDHRPVCSGDTSCGDNESFAYREMNDGSWGGVCVSNESNPPTCPYGFDGVLEIYDNGFACGQLNEDKESDKNDSSDGDSDGDGQADDNGMAGQLEDIKGLLRDGNNEVGNLGESLKKGFGDLTEAIGNIPGGGGGSGDDGNGEGEGESEEPVTWSGEPIDTELTDPTDDYDQVMADYQAKINEIKGEVQAMFSTNLTGGGSVDDNTKTIMGVDVNFSLNRFLSGLDILGAIVLFCAAFISAGILFSGRG